MPMVSLVISAPLLWRSLDDHTSGEFPDCDVMELLVGLRVRSPTQTSICHWPHKASCRQEPARFWCICGHYSACWSEMNLGTALDSSGFAGPHADGLDLFATTGKAGCTRTGAPPGP